MIHTTMGVYANGERKFNGVPSERLAVHIQYNMKYRPGRALFVDGVCLNRGYLSAEEAQSIEEELITNPVIMNKDTQPYQ